MGVAPAGGGSGSLPMVVQQQQLPSAGVRTAGVSLQQHQYLSELSSTEIDFNYCQLPGEGEE